MPFARRTLSEIAAQAKADLQGDLASTAAFFRRSVERALAAAVTGASNHLHGHLEWIARQMDPTKADFDQLQAIHGVPKGVFVKPAVAAKHSVSAAGTNGTTVAAGTVFQRSDGARYTVDTLGTVALGTVALQVTAEIAGDAGTCPISTVLELSSPIAGMVGTATVTASTTLGADAESPDDYLARVLKRGKSVAKGGARGDYETWALEVPGVADAWEYPRQEGAGTVTVYAIGESSGAPTALTGGKIAEISAYMTASGRSPADCDVLVYTPTLQPINFSIQISPNTAGVQAAVITELNEALRSSGHPGGMTVLLSELNEAVSIAPGEIDHVITTPAGNVVVPFGSIPVVGTVTWSTL